MGSANKTTNLGLPQWLGNEYFERADMNDAFKAIDDAQGETAAAIASAKTELEGKIEGAEAAAAGDLASAKAELEATISANKTEAEGDLADAKTELQASIDALGDELKRKWCILLEEGYTYSCTIEEDKELPYSFGALGSFVNLYCCEKLTDASGTEKGKKTTYVFNGDDTRTPLSYDVVMEAYAFETGPTTSYTLTADADGNWSGVWS